MGMDPVTIGLGVSAASSLYGAYEKNKQAKQNQQAVQQRTDTIGNAAQGMMWNGAPAGQDQLMSLIGQMGQTPQIDMGSDGLMQMLRSQPGNNIASTLSGMMQGGNPFDPTSAFAGLAPRDTMAANEAVSGLRGGASGLGQRFGSAMMREEGNLRAKMAADVGARNAGIAQSAWEGAQGRVLQAAGLASGNQNNLMQQLLQARGQDIQVGGMNMDATQRGQSMQMAGIAQLFNQVLGQKQYNQGLLGMQAGLPVAQNTQPGYGSAGSDLGQLLMFLPMLRGQQGPTSGYTTGRTGG